MPNAVYDTGDKLTAWAEMFSQRLGASETPAILGLDPWRTALDVYAAKKAPSTRGQLDAELTPRLCGLIYEPAIARAYELAFRVRLIEVAPRVHPECDDVAASADRETKDGDLVEIKRVSIRKADQWGEPETDEIPESYIVQCQQQMAVYERDRVFVWAAIGDDHRRYCIERNDAIIQTILEAATAFMDKVRRGEMPEPDFSHDATADLLNRLYRPRPGVRRELPAEIVTELDAYDKRSAQITALEKAQKQSKARILAAMGDAELGVVGGFEARRKIVDMPAYSVDAKQQIRLNVRSPKAKVEALHGNCD